MTNNYTEERTKEKKFGLDSDLEDGSANRLFGQRLKNERSKTGFSQKDLAREIDIAKSTYQRLEEGQLPKSGDLIKLSQLFNCSSDYLLGITDKRTQNETKNVEPREPAKQPPEPSEKPPPISELLTKTAEILESGTVYGKALSANIQAFHQATRTEQKLQDLEASMEKRFADLENRIKELSRENQDLRNQLETQQPGRDSGGKAANQS